MLTTKSVTENFLSLSGGYSSAGNDQKLFSSDARTVRSVNSEPWAFIPALGSEYAPLSINSGNPKYLRLLNRTDGEYVLNLALDSSSVQLAAEEPNPSFRRLSLPDQALSYGFFFNTPEIASFFSSVVTSALQDSSISSSSLVPSPHGSPRRPSIRSQLLKRKPISPSASAHNDDSDLDEYNTPLLHDSGNPPSSSSTSSSTSSSWSSTSAPSLPSSSSLPVVSIRIPTEPLSPAPTPERSSTETSSIPEPALDSQPSPLNSPSPVLSVTSSPVSSRSPKPDPPPIDAPPGLSPLHLNLAPILAENSATAPSLSGASTPKSPVTSSTTAGTFLPSRESPNSNVNSLMVPGGSAKDKKKGRRLSFTLRFKKPAERADSRTLLDTPPVHPSPHRLSLQPLTSREASSAPCLLSDNDPLYGNTKRQFAIVSEMVQVQRSYLKILSGLEIELRQKIITSGLLKPAELDALFPCFPALLQLHINMAEDLERRLTEWSVSSTVADIWLRYHPEFSKVYPEYCAVYHAGLESDLLGRLTKKKPLRQLVQAYQASSGLDKLSINTNLGQPVQQPPRYVLLLKDMVRSTSGDHPSFFLLKETLDKFLELASDINSAIQANQNARLLQELRQTCAGAEQLGECTLLWAEPVTVIGQPSIRMLGLTNRSLFFTTAEKTEKNPGLFKAAQELLKIERHFDLLHVWAFLFAEQGTTDRFTIVTPVDSFLVIPKGSKDEVTIAKCVDVINTQLRRYFLDRGFAKGSPPVVDPEDPLTLRRFTLEYPNGEQYTGWWADGLQHGAGALTYPGGNRYTGDWCQGKRQGKGCFRWKRGGFFDGDWKNGRPWGTGKLVSCRGDTYEGQWVNGEKEGQGSQEWPNGDKYVGGFQGAHMHGEGTLVSTFGNYTYQGEFRLSHPHGHGALSWLGNRYEGQFVSGYRAGHGRVEYANGDSYEGMFQNDAPSGKGRMSLRRGAWVYEGTMVDGAMTGVGKISVKDGWVYEGGVDNGQRIGSGRCAFEDGAVYEGSWEHDQFCGHGTFQYEGYSYTGGWKDGLRHGSGTEVRADGFKYEGAFDHNRYHGVGSMTDAKGNSYHGDWVRGRRSGQGESVAHDGSYRYKGQWLDDKHHGEGTLEDRANGTCVGHFEKGFVQGTARFVSADKTVTLESPSWMFNLPTGICSVFVDGVPSTANFVFDQSSNSLRPNFDLLNFTMIPAIHHWKL